MIEPFGIHLLSQAVAALYCSEVHLAKSAQVSSIAYSFQPNVANIFQKALFKMTNLESRGAKRIRLGMLDRHKLWHAALVRFLHQGKGRRP
jgi:hypothetical protein